jgi:4-hydroxy-3-methylbut-2-enyl diphosphate reductase
MSDSAIEQTKRSLDVYLAQPRGFCAGVERAIEIVERALDLYGAPVYVRHEIVHNARVVESLKAKGACFVEEIDEIPDGAITIFSAHGVAQKVENAADGRDLEVIDATCPLVSKVHKEGRRYASRGYDVVLIGHPGHPEVEGTIGQIPGRVHLISCVEDVVLVRAADPTKLAYVTQTTLSVDDTKDIIAALKQRFPEIVGPDVRDICYATQNRQTSVRQLAKIVDLVLVVGASNSSNSNRLTEIAALEQVPSYLVEDAKALDLNWFENVAAVGITAGASAPEELVRELVDRLGDVYSIQEKVISGVEENVQFKLPEKLLSAEASKASPVSTPVS